MKITASITTALDGRSDRSIPTMHVDDEVYYFASPKGLPSHVTFLGEADALNHSMNTLDILRKIIRHTLKASGFLVDKPE